MTKHMVSLPSDEKAQLDESIRTGRCVVCTGSLAGGALWPNHLRCITRARLEAAE